MPPVNITVNGTLTGLDSDGFQQSPPTPFPTSSMPAWAPSVAVASAMLIFLAASFYIRHRKVVKKREILMDYFYIIFQYGGLRRKRMVAALCNTNAITLRELGRSFMISFDSVNNPENSCPFFLEDSSAFGGCQNFAAANSAHKKTFFNRAMVNSRKYRMPFRRNPTNLSDENPGGYPVSFHDILMKFKSKRPPPPPPGTPCMRPRNPSQIEMQGSSMCTIHGDDFDYQKYMEENEINSPVFYNRTRRNAYVPQPGPKLGSKFADLVCEAKRHSLGSVYQEHMLNEGKRNSEPFENHGPGGVFQVYGDRLAPTDASGNPRNLSEPTILVHSASSDWSNDGNGWTELPGPSGEGGVVFVRRLSRVDAQPGEYTYCHDSVSLPQLGLPKRANLSKVNVQSVNTAEYYNCLQRDTTISQTPDKSPANTPDQNTSTREPGPGPPRRARGRLSLGEIAISNLNRRIDLTSESLKEYYPDVTDRSKNRWARFKHVFSGSRLGSSKSSSIPSNHSSGKGKALVSSIAEERPKKRGHQRASTTRWQKFVNVFTGFRSLPEENSTQTEVKVPSGSRSYPADLNKKQASSSYERADSIDLDIDTDHTRMDIDPQLTPDEPGHAIEHFEKYQPNREAMPRSPGVSSLREGSPMTRPGARRFRSVFLAYKATRPSTFTGSKRYRKRYDSVTSSSQSLPYVSNLDFRASPSSHTHEISPLAREDMNYRVSRHPGVRGCINLETEAPGLYTSNQDSHSPDDHSPCHDYSPRRAHSPRDNLILQLDQSPHHHKVSRQELQSHQGSGSHASDRQSFPSNRGNAAPYVSGFTSKDADLDRHGSQMKSSHSYPHPFDSSKGSDCYTDQALCALLPDSECTHRPSNVPLSQMETNQNLLSPQSWQACASVESVYYDTLSSPVNSPLPTPRAASRHGQPNKAGSKTRFDYSSHEHQSLRSTCDLNPRPQIENHRLASPDWRPHRRRSEELRPKTSEDDKSPRRRSAVSNMTSIGSSLLASTEVILVPMTISAPDSPVTSRPSSPCRDHNRSIKGPKPTPAQAAPAIRLTPSHCPKQHSPIRLTVSCPNRSKSDMPTAMNFERVPSSHYSKELKRKSITLQVESMSSSTPATPTRNNLAFPPTRPWTPEQVQSADLKCPDQPVHQTPGEVTMPAGSSTLDQNIKGPTNGGRPARLMRQTSQDVRSGSQMIYPTPWEPVADPVEESLEPDNHSMTSTTPTPSPQSQQPTTTTTTPGTTASNTTSVQLLPESHTSISKAEMTFELQDAMLTPDSALLPARRCSYDTLI